MKKSTLILATALTTSSLVAFGFKHWSDPEVQQAAPAKDAPIASKPKPVYDITDQFFGDFLFSIAPRYGANFTKEEMKKVSSMADFDRKRTLERIVSYSSVTISILDDDYNAVESESENGVSGEFNAAQLELLRSAPYSTDILIRSEYQQQSPSTGLLVAYHSTPHLTIVPEKQAMFSGGMDALIAYLKMNSMVQTSIVEKDKLKPGMIRFTVTKNGMVSNVVLLSTSGYPSIDSTMVDLMNKAPNNWEPAANSKGERVEQELVFSFGVVGC